MRVAIISVYVVLTWCIVNVWLIKLINNDYYIPTRCTENGGMVGQLKPPAHICPNLHQAG